MSNPDPTFAVLLIAITVTLWLLYYVRARLQRRWFAREGMPDELQQSRLIASEKEIWGHVPRPLYGTMDQMFLLKGRRLSLVETKNHRTGLVYESDRIQISVYAAIVRNSWWRRLRFYKMSSYGYIRVVSDKTVRYVKVEYMSDQEVAAYYDKYIAIIDGCTNPRYTRIKKLCGTCAYRSKCKNASMVVPHNSSEAVFASRGKQVSNVRF